MKQRIVLLGPPASGKGTQAEMIQSHYHLPTASPGAILREECKLGTPLGIEAERSTSQGRLVSDTLVNDLVWNWLSRHDHSFVFDGYPRSLGQAAALDAMLADRESPLESVILLEADQQTIRDRVNRRLMCEKCGRIASRGLHIATPDSSCPSCAGRLTRRSDDSPETLALRMNEYALKTEPLCEHYRDSGLLHTVDATRAPQFVFASIVSILESP